MMANVRSIVPEYQRRGFGKEQIQELLRIFRSRGFHTAFVLTSSDPFYVPAQRTYESCGFVLVRTTADNNLEYELKLEELPKALQPPRTSVGD